MQTYRNETFDEERALYGSQGVTLVECHFDGPADGESALKESRDIDVQDTFFNLRYPFWHDEHLQIANSELTEFCRAAIWYSRGVRIKDSRLHGIKALRECADVVIANSDIDSAEFGWSVNGIKMLDTHVKSEYFMLRSSNLQFDQVTMQGKYSFQYIEDAVFTACNFDTKDAFWHAENVTVRDSVIKGEYLAWYAENITFENCTIIGTQPFCYCKNLKLINCRMIGTDLAFEKSTVQATILTVVDSIKNPQAGTIQVAGVGELIMNDPEAQGRVILTDGEDKAMKITA
ncbi:Protein of unknown function [Selenomonas sp. WCT3]|uniref:DUF3737 family protein n=1 Tax=Selenomonas sp. WCT3 TaxID=3158785 RepID=UPI000884DB2D|nr:Protein of unknown function [Selenomonas ruminantium]